MDLETLLSEPVTIVDDIEIILATLADWCNNAD